MLYELIAIVRTHPFLHTHPNPNATLCRFDPATSMKPKSNSPSPQFNPAPHPETPSLTNHSSRIARNAGSIILRSSGVVRGITNWGPFLLPRPKTAHQTHHHNGHYFLMRFDSSAATQAAMCRSLKLDPRMIRFSVIKLAQRLGTRGQIAGVEAIEGKVDWMATEGRGSTGVDSFMTRTTYRANAAAQEEMLSDDKVE